MAETTERTYSFGKLGRGITSLISEPQKPEEVAQQPREENTGARMVSIERIKPSQFQPRTEFDPTALQELSTSIAKSGIIQPIVVRSKNRDEYEIIAGERRWRASKMAGLQQVPIVIRQLSDREVIELALVENIQRRDLNPLEEAYGFRRLLGEFGYTQDDLSRVMGKSRSHIANILRLLSLPEPVKNMLVEGKLTMSHARALVGYEDAESLAQKISEFGLSVRETEIMVQQGSEMLPESDAINLAQNPAFEAETLTDKNSDIKADTAVKAAKKITKRATKSSDVKALEEMLTRNLNAFVDIRAKGKKSDKGEIRIKYKSLEELDGILAKIG